MPPDSLLIDVVAPAGPVALCGALRREGAASLLLEGGGRFADGWGPRVAVDPRVLRAERTGTEGALRESLAALDRVVEQRRRRGGSPGTGIAVAIGYELFAGAGGRTADDTGLPDMVVLAVDASVAFEEGAPPRLAVRAGRGAPQRLARARSRVEPLAESPPPAPAPVPGPPSGALATSLPRDAYLRAVDAVRSHIRRGDVYQANLTQRFVARTDADPFDLYRALVGATPAPRAAFLETADFALASASPEIFLSGTPDGRVRSHPIKGTRRRGATPDEDRRAAAELLASEKDRAELLMIVDLERNDLGRVSRTGSVRVSELASLRSYAAVHHLVACVEGTLCPGIGPADLLRATFPGGSITGAPKRRAIEILRDLEPVTRSFYTGCLVWLGDDGGLDSSILIRSIVAVGGRALVGAGGGVVWDSEPELEWRESCDKARALLGVLGREPEEAC